MTSTVSRGGNDVLYGGAGEDWLNGGYGNDVLYGGTGNDGLAGEQGDDYLFGGDGADRLNGDNVDTGDVYGLPGHLHGADFLDGGAGDDMLWGNGGADTLYGGEGNDILFGDDGMTAAGYHGDDILYGESGNDILLGEGGDDWLSGGDGNDALYGDSDALAEEYHGNDVLYGDAGNDTLIGGGGHDTLFGGAGDDILAGDSDSVSEAVQGNDYLDGGAGNDYLRGYGGDDWLYGGSGNDTLFGEAGNDYLDGGTGDDQLIGGDGNDVLVAGRGNDYLWGGQGNDVYRFGLGGGRNVIVDFSGENVVEFGPGIGPGSLSVGSAAGALFIRYGQGDDLTIYGAVAHYRFADGTAMTGHELMALLNDPIIQNGTEAADTMMGGAGNDLLWGGDGDDELVGGGGRDHLFGGNGDDVVIAGHGNDVVYGEAGNDNLLGGEGADSLIGGIGNDLLFGDAGADRLWGNEGDDTLYGGDGDDELMGGPGNDVLIGGRGNDWLIGGSEGSKTYLFDIGDGQDTVAASASDRHIHFGDGIVESDLRLYLSPANATQQYVLLEYSVDDRLYIQLGAATGALDYRFSDGSVLSQAQLVDIAIQEGRARYALFGTAGPDTLSSGNQPTLLEGGAGNDHLHGHNHDDVLKGGSGNDVIIGDSGADTLDGGMGADSLWGGAGSDVYLFRRGDGQDEINEQTSEGSGDVNVLRLGEDILAEDVRYTRTARGDLVIAIAGSLDSITVRNWFLGASYQLQEIVYGNGDSQDMGALALLQVPDIVASPMGSLLKGDQYNNRLLGGAGNDTLDGGWGSDTLVGGAGSDTYQLQWARGYDDAGYEAIAPDVVTENGPELNYLRLPMGLDFSGLVFERRGDDLYVGVQGVRNVDFSTYAWEGNTDPMYAPGGLLLTGYYAGVDNWIAQTSAGHTAPLSDLILQANLPPQDFIQSAHDAWLTSWRQVWLAEYLIETSPSWYDFSDYEQTGDYRMESWSDDDHWTYDLIVTDAYSDDSVIDVFPGQIYIHTPGVQVTIPVGDIVYAGASSSSSNAAGSIPYLGGVRTLPPGTSLTIPRYDYSNLDANGDPALVGYEFFYSSGTSSGGYSDSLSDYLTSSQPHTVTITVSETYWAEVIEVMHAGSSDNVIYTGGGMGVYAGDGNDTIHAEGSNYYVVGAFLYGEDGDDLIFGSYENDVLLGGNGNDLLSGGEGDDTYLINPDETGLKIVNEVLGYSVPATGIGYHYSLNGRYSLDTIEFAPGITLDDIRISISSITMDSVQGVTLSGSKPIYEARDITWGDGSQVVRVILPDDDDTAYGGSYGVEYFKFSDGTRLTHQEFLVLGFTITGTDGDDVLTGGAGNDTLRGMDGDDTLYGDAGNDRLETGYGNDIAYGGAGNDTIIGGDNVSGTFTWESLYGEDGDDLIQAGGKFAHLYGGAGNDELRGGSGFSQLYGEDGNDTLISGTGYGLLNGGAGADLMVGNAFANSYWVDNVGDVIIEVPDGGIDTVNSSISYVLAADLENLNLIGSEAITGTGNDGNNTLSGANNTAANVLIGGLGDDTYTIDAGDTIVELAGEGVDSVYVSFTYTLGANLENLTLGGGEAINGTGNNLDNRLVGNSVNNVLNGGAGNDYLSGMYGNDTLNGGTGADEMLGGYGNDVYYVDNVGDVVTELSGQGTDTVNSSISYALTDNVERLTLTGGAAIDGAGNGLNNILNGNSAANVLVGNAGNDTLNGGNGNDTLIGGVGNDRLDGGRGSDLYKFARGDGQDVVNDYNAQDADPTVYGPTTDVLEMGADIGHDQLWFSRSGNNLQVQIIGTNDRVLVENWYLSEAYQIEEFHAGDGYQLLNEQVEQLVQAMAAFSPPASGELNLPESYRIELDPVLAANWQAA